MACKVAQGDLSIINGILDNNMHVILIKTWSRVFKYICSIYFDSCRLLLSFLGSVCRSMFVLLPF
jgi:hypothetical protein